MCVCVCLNYQMIKIKQNLNYKSTKFIISSLSFTRYFLKFYFPLFSNFFAFLIIIRTHCVEFHIVAQEKSLKKNTKSKNKNQIKLIRIKKKQNKKHKLLELSSSLIFFFKLQTSLSYKL
jgi:hypothetical protein